MSQHRYLALDDLRKLPQLLELLANCRELVTEAFELYFELAEDAMLDLDVLHTLLLHDKLIEDRLSTLIPVDR